ncbi:MAG: M48 family metallopeptidase [Elusimicrobiota bacterium]
MNIFLLLIILFIAGDYLFKLIAEILNIKNTSDQLPAEFKDYYDSQKYKKSQQYLKDKTKFNLVESGFFDLLIIVFILTGGFNTVDLWARNFGMGKIITGLIFIAILFLGMSVISIPFDWFKTFVIEEKYDFNKTDTKTFILDRVKSLFLGLIIGGPLLALILWFFYSAGSNAWLYCWIAVIIFQYFLLYISPVVILPLFNEFTPLKEGKLRKAIEDYARKMDFKIKGIFKIDGSRRSTKSNAYFTGLGKFKRIALFDTLIDNHSVDEIVSVLAHEVGHYTKKHIHKLMGMSVIKAGITFFLLSFFIDNPRLFKAFQMENISVYGGIVFFSFLYTPVNSILGIVTNIFSRKYEYQADRFAVDTYKNPEAFTRALKKLTVDNLGNLTPHPFKVFIDYSHPPVLQRIKAIKNLP